MAAPLRYSTLKPPKLTKDTSFLDDVTCENLAILPTSHIPQDSFMTWKGGLVPFRAVIVAFCLIETDSFNVFDFFLKKNGIGMSITHVAPDHVTSIGSDAGFTIHSTPSISK